MSTTFTAKGSEIVVSLSTGNDSMILALMGLDNQPGAMGYNDFYNRAREARLALGNRWHEFNVDGLGLRLSRALDLLVKLGLQANWQVEWS